MATFNLTAQLNLKGPTNVKQIAAQIKKDLGSLNANVQFKLDPAAAKNVSALASSLKTLNSNFATTVKSANSATAAIKAFGNSINSVKITNVPQQINQTSSAITKLNKVSAGSAKGLQSAATEMQEFGKQAGLAVRRFVAFSAVTSVIYGVTSSINNGIQAFIDYDKELVKLQQVTGESAAGLSKLQSQIGNLAVEFGVSSKELTQVASTLAQAGLSARETEKALKALALSSLAPSFDNMNETVEGSIAIMRQFGISANDLEASLGAVNAVAARFAVESSDIITAVQRTGSVFATASKGVSEGKDALNEFISVFTSIRATSRESAETIATGLRTIFTRVQRGTTIDALKEFGVNLTDAEGKFVGAYKAVELLSKGLGKIDPRSLDFSRIVEELGGFRQIGKVIPLIQQFTVTQQALKVAQQGQSSLAKDAATAQLSLANQISKVREEFFALFREIGQSKGFQSLVRGALSLTSGLIKVADAVKGILPALAVLAAFKGFKALTEFTTGFATGVKRGPDGKANGGVIKKFARGGVVPGTGSGDTVPAMLEPGEFVIRKKAVETIGTDNLHNMNKYGSGGSIRGGRAGKRKKFKAGGKAEKPLIEDISYNYTYDGDSLNVDYTPTEYARTYAQTNPGSTKLYKDKNKKSSYSGSSRLIGIDTPELSGSGSRGGFTDMAKTAHNITESWAEKQSHNSMLEAFQSVNELDFYDRPMFHSSYLVKQLKTEGVAKNFSMKRGSKLPADIFLGRIKYLQKKFPNTEYKNLVDEVNDSEDISWPNARSGKKDIEFFKRYFFGGTVQKFASGGQVSRNIGIIDTDVLRDPANTSVVKKEMEKLGITDVSDYTTRLGEFAAKARKNKSLSKFIAIAGAAGSGKSSLATGKGANDNASLRKTTRSQILTPEDIDKVNEVIVLTSTASQTKLDAYLKDVDRAYVLSSNSRDEQDRVRLNRDRRDTTGEGLYGRKPGTTRTADTDFGLEETILRDELGKKATVLGRKKDSFGLRRKKENELPEIVQAGGFYMGGFAPPTRGHRGALDTLLNNMLAKNPSASLEDILVSVAPDLPMIVGKEGIDHAARYGIFPADLRALFSQMNFGDAMISTQSQTGGGLPKFMEVAGAGDRRKFARLKGAMAITSGKDDKTLGKYQRAGIDVKDIPRIEDISATAVRDALFQGDDKTLTSLMNPDIASVLMGNRAQLRNRSTMVPMLIEEIQKFVDQDKVRSNAEVAEILSNAPGGPYGNVSADLKKNYPEIADQVKQIRDKRDRTSKGAFGYRAYNIISALSAKYPDMYGLDPSRRASVSAQPSDLTKEAIFAQLSEQMGGEFGGVPTDMPSGLEEAILKNVEKATQVKKSSGILPTQGTEILKRFGSERLPNDPSFGPFSGKTVRDTADGGKLKYWNSAFRPETKADKLAYYTATRDYLIDKFNGSQGTQKATALKDTTSAVLSSTQLGLVGLNPLGYTGLLGPETWNLGTDSSGKDRSINASIVQRGLPTEFQNVIDYLSGQTAEIVQGASKLLGITPKELTKKQRETLGQGNIEGALLEQIFGSADATILDDALRTRPIDFPMGIGPKAAKIFGIDPNIPTEVKRTIDSGSRSKAVEEFQRHFRQQYGIPEPKELETVQKLARGGKASRRFTFSKEPIGPSPFDTPKSSVDYFSLEQGSGFSALEFNSLARDAKTFGLNLEEFGKMLETRRSRKAALSGVKTDLSSLLGPEVKSQETIDRQNALAKQLMGEPDAGYRPIKRYAEGGEAYSSQQLVSLAKYRTGPFPGGGTNSEFINRYLEDNNSFMEYLKTFHADPPKAYDATKNAAKDLLEMFTSQESMSGSKRSGKLYSTVAGGKLKTILTQINNPLNSSKDISDAIGKNFNLNGSLLSTSESPDTAAVFQPENGSSAMLSIFRNKNIPSIDVDKTIFDTSTEDEVIKALSKYIDPVSGKNGVDYLSRSRSATRIEKEFILPPTSKFRIDDIDRIISKDQEDKLLGGNIRHIEGMKVQQFANGGQAGISSKDTVPALLTPGEFVVNKKAAEKIGYGKLEKLNKADKIQGYNKGGIVGGVQRFALGGGVDGFLSALQSIASNLGRTQNITNNRPNSIDTSTIAVDPSILQDTKAFVDTLYDAGDGMKYLNSLLNENKQLSIQAVLEAGNKDVERLKISGASIDKIIEAEKALSNIRNKGLIDVTKRQFLESGFKESSVGKKLGSGATQQKILSLAEKEERRLIDKRKKAIEADIVSSSKQPIAASDLADQVAQAISSELDDIKSQAFAKAATAATGTQTSTGIKGNITASELKNLNISGNDIQKYISDSMRDRKTLRQMDQQLIATRMEEYKNAGTIRGISVASAEEAKKLAQEEVSKRREAINDLAQMRGERGVGAAGLMDTRNSPINRAFKERYFTGNLGRSMQRGLGDVGLAAGLVAGQGQNISSALFDTKTDKGKIKAADAGARIDKAATTLSVGLTTSAQLAAINPMLGAAAAIGTALYAGADAAFDFSGTAKKAAQEMTRSLLNDKLSAASDNLSNALEKLSKDVNNVDLRAKTASAVKALTDTSIESTANTATAGKNKAENDRSWSDFFRGILLDPATIAKSKKGSYGMEEARVDAQKEVENYQKIANAGYGDLERLYAKGFSNDQIMDPNNQAGNIVRESLKGMILSDPEKLALYMASGPQGREAIAGKAAQDKFLANDELAKASQESAKLARAMDLADKAGRRLAASFDKIADIVNESINKISFESDARAEATAQYASSLRGESTVSGPKLRERNILDNPNAYSEAEFTKALETATAGLDAGTRKQLIGGAQLQQSIPKNITQSIATVLKTSASAGVDEAKKAAIDTAKNEIENNPNLSRQQKDELKQIATAKIENMAKKAKDNNADNSIQLSEFQKELADGTNILGDFGKKLLDSVKALSSFKEGALDKFAKGLNEASKAAKEAQVAFRKAREITNEGNMNLREVLKGYGETYDEKSNRIMGDVSNLAGGETTAQGIKNRQIQLAEQRKALEKSQGALTDKDALRKNVEQLNKLDDQLRDNKEALDLLANSTELVDKAFSDLQNTAELQNNRQNFVNQLLTNTPEEADKLNQSFIRLQRNLSGGLNSPYNQRDARKAFNEALFKTGNVREATRAGNTVLANQRKETLSLMQDPGFRAAQELQIRNKYAQNKMPGVDKAVQEYFQKQQLQITKQMAIESGMINNPLVQQSLAALEDRKADPAMQKAAERYLEAVGLRSGATKAQGELALMESQSILKDSNDNLRVSIDNLRASVDANMKNANIGKDAAGNNIVNSGVAVPAPPAAAVPKSSGGMVYASSGKLIDFKPKGTDNVPAMLTPGEFVINARSTAEHLPLLKAINSGNYSKGGVVYLAQGGSVNPEAQKIKSEELRRQSLWLKGSKGRSPEEETEYATLKSNQIKREVGPYTVEKDRNISSLVNSAALPPITSNGGKPGSVDPATAARINEGYSRPSNAQQVAEQNAAIESGIAQQYTTNKPLQKPDPNDPKYQTRNPLEGMANRIANNRAYEANQAKKRKMAGLVLGLSTEADQETADLLEKILFGGPIEVPIENNPAREERQAALTTNIINQALNKKTPDYSIATPTSGDQTTKTEQPTREFIGSSASRRALSAVANNGGTLAEANAAAKNAIQSQAERSKSIVEKRKDEGKKVVDYYEQRLNEARADNDGDGRPDFSNEEIDKRKRERDSARVNFSGNMNPIGRKPESYYASRKDAERWGDKQYTSAEDYFAAQGARQDYLDRQARIRKENEASAEGFKAGVSHVVNMTEPQYAAAFRSTYGDTAADALGRATRMDPSVGRNNENTRIKDEEKKTRETFDRAKNYEGPLGTAAYIGDTFTQGVVGALPQDRARNDSQEMKDINARRDAYREREKLAGNKDFSFENSSNPIFAGMGSAARSATTMYQGTIGAGLNLVGGVGMNSMAGYADAFGNPLLANEFRRKGDEALTAVGSDVGLLGAQASRVAAGQGLAQVKTAGEKLDEQNVKEAGSLGFIVKGSQFARDAAVDAALPIPIPGAGRVRSVAGRLDDMDEAARRAYSASQRAPQATEWVPTPFANRPRSSNPFVGAAQETMDTMTRLDVGDLFRGRLTATEATIPKMAKNYVEKLPIPSEATGPMGSMGRLNRGEALSRSLKDLREVKVPSLRSDPMDMSKLGKSAKQSQPILDPLQEGAKSANKPRITAAEYTKRAEEARAAARASKPRVTAEEFMARTKPDVTTLPTKRPLPEVIDVTDTKTLRQVQENLASDLADYATPAKRDQFLSEFVEKSTPQSVSVDPEALAEAKKKVAKAIGPVKAPSGMVTSDNRMIFRDAKTKTSVVQHELAHSFQTKTAGMKIDPFGSKKLQLSGLMKEIESFVDDPMGLVAITGGKGYSASQIKQAPYELLSTLMQHMGKVKGNKRAERILKELMKFHGYNKGGLVTYYNNGGRVNDRSYTESPEYKAAEKEKQIQNVPKSVDGAMTYASGGLVYANNGALVPSLSQGTDTVPAMLTEGEFVINKKDSKKHMPLLNAINSGRFNRGGIVNYLANGGMAGPQYFAAGGTSQLAPISNAGQTLKQTASSSGGVSNNVSIDTANIASSIQDAVTNAIGQFNEYTEQIGANFTEQFNSAQKSLSSSIDTFQTATAQFGEHANAIPTSLSANVTQTTSLHHLGLDSIKGNMEQKIYDQTSVNAQNISQNNFMQFDKNVLEGGANTAAKQRIIGRTV